MYDVFTFQLWRNGQNGSFISGTRKTIIWCPFDEYNDSEYINVFLEKDFEVKYTHIKNGEDFLEYETNEIVFKQDIEKLYDKLVSREIKIKLKEV